MPEKRRFMALRFTADLHDARVFNRRHCPRFSQRESISKLDKFRRTEVDLERDLPPQHLIDSDVDHRVLCQRELAHHDEALAAADQCRRDCVAVERVSQRHVAQHEIESLACKHLGSLRAPWSPESTVEQG